MTKSVGGLVLAAGMSARMKKFKPLLPLGGKVMIQQTVESLLQAEIKDIVVVLGKNAAQIKEALAGYDICYATNADYETTDMLKSIQIGLALCREKEALFVLPADMPLVRAETLKAMVKRFSEKEISVLYPTYQGKRGHPPLIAKKCFAMIEGYRADGGLRAVLAEIESEADEIETSDIGCVLDADYEQDYVRLQEVLQLRQRQESNDE